MKSQPPGKPRETSQEETEQIWTCKVGGTTTNALPPGSDLPMRQAVGEAFERITGRPFEYIFSGWGGALTERERAVVEDRIPRMPTEPTAQEVKQDAVDRDCDITPG